MRFLIITAGFIALALGAYAAVARAHEPDLPSYETVVTAPLRPVDKSSASEVKLERADLDGMPRRSVDDLLRLVPGLLAVQHGSEGKGQQFFLRGFDAEHGSDIEVSLHGIPLNQASNVHGHGYLDLAFLPAEVLERVDVIKGPFEATQGDFATAGSLRLHLGVPRGRRGLWTRYQAGNTERHRVSLVWAPVDAPEPTFAAGEFVQDEGFGQRRHSQRASLLASAQLGSPGQGLGELQVLGGLYAARFALPGALRWRDVARQTVGFYDAYTTSARGEVYQALSGLGHRRTFEAVTISSTGFAVARALTFDENFTGYLVDPVLGDGRRQHDGSLRAGLGTGVRWLFPAAFTAHARAIWQVQSLRQFEVARAEQGDLGAPRRRLAARQQQGTVLAELSYWGSDCLTLSVGGRVDVWHFAPRDLLHGRGVVPGVVPWLVQGSPRLHAAYAPHPVLTAFFSYGHGFRSPEARAFTQALVPASDVPLPRGRASEPRTTASRTGEAGFSLLPQRPVNLDAALFATWIARESIFDHVAGTNLEKNATRRVGIDFAISVVPVSWMLVRADATLVDARFVESGASIPAVPTRMASIYARASHPKGWFGSLRVFALGPRALAHGARAAGFVMTQAMAGYRYGPYEITLEADNLLDQEIPEGQYHYASAWDRGAPPDVTPAVHFVAGPPLLVRAGLGVRL